MTVPQQINRLTDRQVRSLSKPGRHADGAGLYLVVDKTGTKRWVFMSWRGGRQIEVGLGGLKTVSLKAARISAANCRMLVENGEDPRRANKPVYATPQFGEFAIEVVTALEEGFRNEKHRQQWRNTLATYARRIWRKPIDEVDTDDVLSVLKPIWKTKQETASRVRGRVERVLDAAAAKGLRDGANPARWRGHLQTLLPKREKLARGHHPAMPYAVVPEFIEKLRKLDSVSARSLEFVILTACRSGEALLKKRDGKLLAARWEEFDMDQLIWTIPAERMKAGRAHRVPLALRAAQIVEEMRGFANSSFVFPSQKPSRPLSGMALEMVMRRLQAKPYTVHGFRSSFRDWVGDETDFAPELAEAALAHTLGSAVERAYRRRDALERRREVMDSWAAFCGSFADGSG